MWNKRIFETTAVGLRLTLGLQTPRERKAAALRRRGIFAEEVFSNLNTIRSALLFYLIIAAIVALTSYFSNASSWDQQREKAAEVALAWGFVVAVFLPFIFGLNVVGGDELSESNRFMERLPIGAGKCLWEQFLAASWLTAVGVVLLLGVAFVFSLLLHGNIAETIRNVSSEHVSYYSPTDHLFIIGVCLVLGCGLLLSGMLAGAFLTDSWDGVLISIGLTIIPIFYLILLGIYADKEGGLFEAVSYMIVPAYLVAGAALLRWRYAWRRRAANRTALGPLIEWIAGFGDVPDPRIRPRVQRPRTRLRWRWIDYLPLMATTLLGVPAIVWFSWWMIQNASQGQEHLYSSRLNLLCFLVLIPAAVVGALNLPRNERDDQRHFIYALPLARGRLLGSRLLTVGLQGALLGVIAACAALYAMEFLRFEGNTGSRWFETRMGLVPIIAASAAMLGYTVRMFIKEVIVILPTVLFIAAPWTLALMLTTNAMLQWGTVGMSPGMVSYSIWMLLLMLGMPVLFAYLVFCASPLLHQEEGRRHTIGFAAALFLAVWGSFLIALHPLQTIQLLLPL